MHVMLSNPLALALTGASLFAVQIAQADAGHDHGTPAMASVANSAQPRFAATSDLFELVGVLDGKQLTLYLDRSADNSPVKGARLELELGGTKIDVKPRGDGDFEATLAQPLKPGVIAVTATVAAGHETDLLAGEIEVREVAQAEPPQLARWQRVAAWTAAGLLLPAALAWLVWLRRRANFWTRRRAADVGAAA